LVIFKKSVLPVLIATALSATAAQAQEDCEELDGTPPGLYTVTDEGYTMLMKDGDMVEMGPGDSGYANEDRIACIKRVPRFMDWPCSTDAAQSRKFATYSIDDLEAGTNRPNEIVRRYFEIPEVIEPVPYWKDGEYHLVMSMNEIIQFRGEEYWYRGSKDVPVDHPKRPQSLQIALYVGLNKAVVDTHTLNWLVNLHGEDAIPVTFVFNDSNVVPISYFGPNVSLEEVVKANQERGIKVAEPPMWELGDYTLTPSAAEMQKYFDLPALEDIPADRQQALRADLETYGFSRKPLFVTLLTGTGTLALDQPERTSMAISMGFTNMPVVVFTIETDSIYATCGPGTPAGMDSSSISGESTPEGGTTVPPGPPPPPPPEPPISDQ
jgi:hypothetical protein